MAVVVRQQKVLIQQHYRRSRSMVYEFPGGKIDDGAYGQDLSGRTPGHDP